MKQLDQKNYSLNPEQFVNLAASLSAFFEQTGVASQAAADLQSKGEHPSDSQHYQQHTPASALPPHMQALKNPPRQAVIVKPEPQTNGPPTSTSQGHSSEDDNPFGIDWEKML